MGISLSCPAQVVERTLPSFFDYYPRARRAHDALAGLDDMLDCDTAFLLGGLSGPSAGPAAGEVAASTKEGREEAMRKAGGWRATQAGRRASTPWPRAGYKL